jgi:hypothetical protein
VAKVQVEGDAMAVRLALFKTNEIFETIEWPIDDLDPESATTDRLVARVRSHRAGEEYPTAEVLLGNLMIFKNLIRYR